jgi:hypothetical protein
MKNVGGSGMVSPLGDGNDSRDLRGVEAVMPPTPGPKNGGGSPQRDRKGLDDALDG